MGAEFPTDLGNSLIAATTKTAQATKGMNDNELESYAYTEYAKLERAYGDKLADKLNAAAHMIAELDKKTPGLKNLLLSRGIGDSALIVAQILGRSERYWARRQ